MPCIVDSEKTDSTVTQNNSKLDVSSSNLKMEAKVCQENGVENLNVENGHTDTEEARTNSDDVDNGKNEEEGTKSPEDAPKEEESSDKPEGMTNFIDIPVPRNHNNSKIFKSSSRNTLTTPLLLRH